MSDAVDSRGYWASHSPVTAPGALGAKATDELPAELGALREVSSQLVFHYRAGRDWAANGVPADRASEIDIRYADAMLDRLLRRGEPVRTYCRDPAQRRAACGVPSTNYRSNSAN